MLYEGFEVLGRALFCLKLGYTALILGFCVALDLIDLLIYYVCVCVSICKLQVLVSTVWFIVI